MNQNRPPAENQPDHLDDGKPDGQSRVARAYRLTKEARGKVFRDLVGRTYRVDEDGSMRRLDKPLSKKKRRRLEAKNGR